MEMKAPVHPGRIIKSELDELGISVAAAAKGLGVTRQHLHNVIAGKTAVSAEMAVRLQQGLGSTADFWLQLQANYDLALVRSRAERLDVQPLVPKVAAE